MTEQPKTTRKRGRPAYRATLEDRQIVEQMKFCGESDTTIARALGIDPDTMRKHFPDELADGHAHRRKEVIGLLFTAARNGNVAATKKLEEMGRAAGAAEAVKAREPRSAAPGKKEERQAAAEAVAAGNGKFAPPAAPRLVVNN